MPKQIYDVAIVGAGPIGSSLALGLAQKGFDIAIIDPRLGGQSAQADLRNFAIVTGSWRFLEHLGIASQLESDSQPLNGLNAVDGGTHWFGRPSVLFDSADLEQNEDAPLGQMVVAGQLQAALDAALEKEESCKRFEGRSFETLETQSGLVHLTLSGSTQISTRLIIGADGLNSPVRKALGIQTQGRDYDQSVFTANVKLERPHNGIAQQLFTPEGPFATLPLKGARANLAWYLKRGAAEALTKRSKSEIEAELNHRFSSFAGRMSLEGKAGSYPLILQIAERIIAPRTALVGDAARRINPLAGQGLNQGFRDVTALIDALSDAAHTGLDIGSDAVLETYSHARRLDGLMTGLSLDALDRLFSNDSLLTKPVRSLGLFAAQNVPFLRKILAQKASATEPSVSDLMRL